MMETAYRIDTPLAPMRAVIGGGRLVALDFATHRLAAPGPLPADEVDRALLARIRAQVVAWWDGSREEFDLPLAPCGTPFQRAVWEAASAVRRGEITTYGAIAEILGRRGAARAVGAALGRNPWLLVVPCHRVVGADGGLTGYAGGPHIKRALLAAEAALARIRQRNAC